MHEHPWHTHLTKQTSVAHIWPCSSLTSSLLFSHLPSSFLHPFLHLFSPPSNSLFFLSADVLSSSHQLSFCVCSFCRFAMSNQCCCHSAPKCTNTTTALRGAGSCPSGAKYFLYVCFFICKEKIYQVCFAFAQTPLKHDEPVLQNPHSTWTQHMLLLSSFGLLSGTTAAHPPLTALWRLETKMETDLVNFPDNVSLGCSNHTAATVPSKWKKKQEQLLLWLHLECPASITASLQPPKHKLQSLTSDLSPSRLRTHTHPYKEYQWAYCFHFKGKHWA